MDSVINHVGLCVTDIGAIAAVLRGGARLRVLARPRAARRDDGQADRPPAATRGQGRLPAPRRVRPRADALHGSRRACARAPAGDERDRAHPHLGGGRRHRRDRGEGGRVRRQRARADERRRSRRHDPRPRRPAARAAADGATATGSRCRTEPPRLSSCLGVRGDEEPRLDAPTSSLGSMRTRTCRALG